MKLTIEFSLSDFEAWCGAKDTLSHIIDEGGCEQLEAMLEELYPDGMTETELNDLLWFEPETCYEWAGVSSPDAEEEEEEEEEEEYY